MKQDAILPCKTADLRKVEEKFGYDHKVHRYGYLIDGERYYLHAILEQSRPLGLADAAISERLSKNHSHTWTELLRPAVVGGTVRNEDAKQKKKAKMAKSLRWRDALLKAEREKRAYFAAKKNDHKDLP